MLQLVRCQSLHPLLLSPRPLLARQLLVRCSSGRNTSVNARAGAWFSRSLLSSCSRPVSQPSKTAAIVTPVSLSWHSSFHTSRTRFAASTAIMAPNWTHLIRFIAVEDGLEHLGQVDAASESDVGLSSFEKKEIKAKVINGSAFDGVVTDKVFTVSQLLSPIAMSEVPIIRCLGLNYHDHAKEANMPVPSHPVLFIKPRTSLAGPYPQKTSIPKFVQDGTSDYEAELAFIITKDGRDIPEDKALDYVLGYTCSNDVSARTEQFRNSQWSYSKGLDGACPIGPVLVSPSVVGDAQNLAIKAILNGETVQDSSTSQMIFSVAKTIAFLSQGTTLERGTVILMGTPPGIGYMKTPRLTLSHGDDMRVYIEKIGTLINEIYHE